MTHLNKNYLFFQLIILFNFIHIISCKTVDKKNENFVENNLSNSKLTSLDATNINANSVQNIRDFNRNFPKVRISINDSIYSYDNSKIILDTLSQNWIIYEIDKTNQIIKLKRI